MQTESQQTHSTDHAAERAVSVDDVIPAELVEIDLYEKREKIYTRHIEGFFQRIRLFTGWPLLLGYLILPWINLDGSQAVLFDLPRRSFYILGLTFWPRDLHLLAFLLIIAAFALFSVTTLAGRIWCGYTCPQTVWTSIFMWWEQKTEGSRNQRMRLDAEPLSLRKAFKKVSKHSGWLFVSFVTGFTFVGYFYPIRDLMLDLFNVPLTDWLVLWTVFFTLATYINAGWMREQVCMYICPYARFQSVMFDSDTLIVSYDESRGEPRGSRKRGVDPAAASLGECIDCQLCVQVCPTGIDIRDGLQYQCIGCALCVDACDSVMKKMEYPTGLIRYTSERALAEGKTRWIRPRIVGYFTALMIMMGVFLTVMITRVPLEVSVEKDRNSLYLTAEDGKIENVFSLRLQNMTHEARNLRLSLEGFDNARLVGETHFRVPPEEAQEIGVRVSVDAADLHAVSTPFRFVITSEEEQSLHAAVESTFLGPSP